MQLVRVRPVVLAIAVGVAASGSVAASAVADGSAPVKRVTYQGLRVSLPGAAKEAPVAGGARIVVRVVAFGRQPKSRPSARITVSRAASGGEKAATVVRKSMRKGSVSFPLSARNGVKYRIQVQIGKRRWVTRLVTTDKSPASTAPCAPSGTVTADLTTVAAGGTIPFRVTNIGTTVLSFSGSNGWSQLGDGVAKPLPNPGGTGAPAASVTVAPGETKSGTGSVWSTLTPGTYGMTVLSTCSYLKPDGKRTFVVLPLQTAPITVTAAAGR